MGIVAEGSLFSNSVAPFLCAPSARHMSSLEDAVDFARLMRPLVSDGKFGVEVVGTPGWNHRAAVRRVRKAAGPGASKTLRGCEMGVLMNFSGLPVAEAEPAVRFLTVHVRSRHLEIHVAILVLLLIFVATR